MDDFRKFLEENYSEVLNGAEKKGAKAKKEDEEPGLMNEFMKIMTGITDEINQVKRNEEMKGFGTNDDVFEDTEDDADRFLFKLMDQFVSQPFISKAIKAATDKNGIYSFKVDAIKDDPNNNMLDDRAIIEMAKIGCLNPFSLNGSICLAGSNERINLNDFVAALKENADNPLYALDFILAYNNMNELERAKLHFAAGVNVEFGDQIWQLESDLYSKKQTIKVRSSEYKDHLECKKLVERYGSIDKGIQEGIKEAEEALELSITFVDTLMKDDPMQAAAAREELCKLVDDTKKELARLGNFNGKWSETEFELRDESGKYNINSISGCLKAINQIDTDMNDCNNARKVESYREYSQSFM